MLATMKTDFSVLPDEQLEELRDGRLFILQKRGGFRFGTDSVLLADFVARGAENRPWHIGDFGTGSGVLPLLIGDTIPRARFTAWELQPDQADMAARSVRANGLDGRINVICGDARQAVRDVGSGALNAVVCNPPYYIEGAGAASPDAARRGARQCDSALLGEFIHAAGQVVRWGGALYIVYPAAFAVELICALRAGRFEPKRLRFVQANANSAPKIMLIEAAHGGHMGLSVMPPLLLSDADGSPSAEYREIYRI